MAIRLRPRHDYDFRFGWVLPGYEVPGPICLLTEFGDFLLAEDGARLVL